jgi:hypothetical protein
MSRAPIYATNASLEEPTPVTDGKPLTVVTVSSDAVIRPPIREAYHSQEAYENAVLQGILYAKEHNIQYINHY